MFAPVFKKWCAIAAAIGALSVTACSPSADATTGHVVRVIDGDTLVVRIADVETTVRLLNIDTPETKHPDEAIECFGPEAAAFLEDTLPTGTEVGLDFDVEREDQYGRTLAAVFLEDRTLVNAEIARQGLGSAVIFEPNRKYYDTVKAAQSEAQKAELGVFSTESECTLPAQVASTIDSLTAVLEQPTASTSAGAAASAAAIAATLVTAEALHASLESGEDSVRWTALGTAATTSLAARLMKSIDTGHGALDKVEQDASRLKTAEDEAAKEAAKRKAEKEAAKREAERVAAEAEARRIAAEAAAIAEAKRLATEAAAIAEAERIRNLPAPAPYVPPAPAPAPYVPPAPAPAPPAEQNPYPGYNGPRCYAPGGKTWKPCG